MVRGDAGRDPVDVARMLYSRTLYSAPADLLPRPLDIYCIAIGGTGMAPLACLLQ
jgi:hypothetical protein